MDIINNEQSNFEKRNIVEVFSDRTPAKSKEDNQVCEFTTQPDCNCEQGKSTDRLNMKKNNNANVVPEVTHEVLKQCNVIREKSLGSRNLHSRTGKVCGAKEGIQNVYEPVMQQNFIEQNKTKRQSRNIFSQKHLPLNKGGTNTSVLIENPLASTTTSFFKNSRASFRRPAAVYRKSENQSRR